jgi:hypothetical protein
MHVAGDARVESGALTQLALALGEDWSSPTLRLRRHLVEHLQAVIREETVLKLRHARLLAWLKSNDLWTAYYPSWTAFVTEHSLWKGSRTRELVRLARGGLDWIKAMVALDLIPLSLALRAVKELGDDASEDAQIDWLEEVQDQPLPARHRSKLVSIVGKDVRIVETARAVAKVLVGWNAPVFVVDAFVIDCHLQGLTREQILTRAREAPGPPNRLGQVVPDWEHEPRPPIAGQWAAPSDLADCLAQLRDNRWRLERRRMLIAMACVHVADFELWKLGTHCTTLAQYCTEWLDVSKRTFERYVREGCRLMLWPEAQAAIEAGLTGDRAHFAMARARGTAIEPMLDLASRLDVAEMERAAELAEPVLDAYGPALAMAHQVEAIVAGGDATAIGGDAARIAQHVASERATAIGGDAEEPGGGPRATRIGIRVSIRDATYLGPSPPPPRALLIPPGLLEAARWFARNVRLPNEHGIRKTVVHDQRCCQNPRCRRTTIRLHVHHIIPGGPDDPWNLIALCPSCHLRGIHSARMRLVRFGDWLVWTWPDGGAVIMHSPMEGRRRAD